MEETIYILELKYNSNSPFMIRYKPGIVEDKVSLWAEDTQLLEWKVRHVNPIGNLNFEYDNKTFEIRWKWNEWTGRPSIMQIFQRDRLIASYPYNAKIIYVNDRPRWHFLNRSIIASFSMMLFMLLVFMMLRILTDFNSLIITGVLFVILMGLFVLVGAGIDVVRMLLRQR